MSKQCCPGKALVACVIQQHLPPRKEEKTPTGKLRQPRRALRTAQLLLVITPVFPGTLSMSFQNKALKTTEEVALQILLLCLVGIGCVANILLFVHNFSSIFTVRRLKPTQVILTNLAVANVFILLATGFTNDMAIFVPRTPPTDLKCKTEFFVCLVARSTNMCSTSILSTYQFVTLVPGNWVRVMLQGRAPNALSYSCYSCWFFGALSNAYISTRVHGPQSTGNDTDSKSKWFCSTSGFDIDMISIWYTHDAVFISIMVWTSVSMVLLLQTPPETVAYSHPQSGPQRPRRDQSCPHHPDAGEHLRELLYFRLYLHFLSCFFCGFSSLVEARQTSFVFEFPHHLSLTVAL